MMHHVRIFALLVVAPMATSNLFQQPSDPDKRQPCDDHVAWVAKALRRIETIKPGMTRAATLRVFTTEGGLSTGLEHTYVSRDCPFFKVDVKFRAVGRPERERDGRVTLEESSADVIVHISRPYLQFTIAD